MIVGTDTPCNMNHVTIKELSQCIFILNKEFWVLSLSPESWTVLYRNYLNESQSTLGASCSIANSKHIRQPNLSITAPANVVVPNKANPWAGILLMTDNIIES